MEFKRTELYIFVGIFILVITRFLDNTLSKFNSSFIPILIIGALAYLSYNFKTKYFRKTPLLLTILAIFFLIKRIRESVTIPLGELIVGEMPLLGFMLIFFISYILILDWKKYHKVLPRSYFISVAIIILIFREKIKIAEWIESATIRIFPGATANALTVGLIILLVVQILAYYLIWKKKSNVDMEFRL